MVEPVTGTPAEAATPTPVEQAAPPATVLAAAHDAPTPQTACEKAAAEVFPKELWAEAFTTIRTEGGTPGGIGQNKDAVGSKDHGCFQINDYWQLKDKKPGNSNPPSRWFSYSAIFDPNYNARVAYNIYKNNGSTWKPWYGPCTPGREKLPRARCGR